MTEDATYRQVMLDAIEVARTIDELNHVKRLTIGPKGFYAVALKAIGRMAKEDRLAR